MAKLNWTAQEKGQYYQDNIKLIHSAIQQFRGMTNASMDYSDLFQVATVGLLKGLDTYDDAAGTALSTYLVTCMHNQVLYETRPSRSKSRSAIVVSYEDHMLGKDGRDMMGVENLDLSDTDYSHPYQPTMEEELEEKDEIRIIHMIMDKYLDETERNLMQMHANGRTQNDIANELGLSQANVSKLIRQTRCRILLHLRRSGYSF